MDEADMADEQSAIFLAEALRRARQPAHAQLPDESACANCDAPLRAGQRGYCDRDCRDDFERRERTLAKQGATR